MQDTEHNRAPVQGFPVFDGPARGHLALPVAAGIDTVSLLYIGALEKRQGLYNAIHAVQLARIRRVRSKLVLAGCGPDVHDLRCFARGLQVADDVAFLDPVFATEKRSLFRSSD